MPPPAKPRQRKVRLTEEAVDLLNKALEERWRLSDGRSKLTRRARSELLGLSLPTVDRILSRQGVDRSSLAEAFKSLGVPWSDHYCESESESEPDTIVQAEAVAPLPSCRRRLPPAWLVVSLILVVALGWALITPKVDWAAEYDRELTLASNFYSSGKLDEAEEHLARVMEIAKLHKTSRNLEATLKLRGDIAAFRGRLPVALELYKATIWYRENANKPIWAPIYEVLATVQIRMKDFDEAKRNLDVAEAAFTKSNEPNGIVEVMRDRGCLAAASGHPEEALEWFEKALQLLATLNAPALVIDVRGERAMVWLQLGRVEEAERELLACLDYWSQDDHVRWVGLTEMRLGQVESKMGRSASAFERVSRARAMFVACGDEARLYESESILKWLPPSP